MFRQILPFFAKFYYFRQIPPFSRQILPFPPNSAILSPTPPLRIVTADFVDRKRCYYYYYQLCAEAFSMLKRTVKRKRKT